MNSDSIAFLRIESIAQGKVEGYSMEDAIPLGIEAVNIGRSSKDPNTPSTDIKIAGDDYISRNQAKICYSVEDNCFMLSDTGSKNGTFLNGELIEQNKPYKLTDYDMISFAKVGGQTRISLRFRRTEQTLPSWLVKDVRKSMEKGGLYIHISSRRVLVDNCEVVLTGKEFKVLEYLYNNRGNACTTDDISWEIWGKEGANDELVAKYISLLRRKLEKDPSNPSYIITVPGRQGCYRLEI